MGTRLSLAASEVADPAKHTGSSPSASTPDRRPADCEDMAAEGAGQRPAPCVPRRGRRVVTRYVAGPAPLQRALFRRGRGTRSIVRGLARPRGLARLIGVSYLAGSLRSGSRCSSASCSGVVQPLRRDQDLHRPRCVGPRGEEPVDPAPRRVSIRVMWPLAAAVIFLVVLMFVDTWFQPLGQWDAWAQWTAKAVRS